MKKMVLSLIFIAASLAEAQVAAPANKVAEVKLVSKEAAATVQKAVLLDLLQFLTKGNCEADYNLFKEPVYYASSIAVGSTGTMPALIFTWNNNQTLRTIVKITTSADYKVMLQVDYSREVFMTVNKGNYLEPQLVDEFVPVESKACKSN